MTDRSADPREVGRFGPFFQLEQVGPGSSGWLPVTALWTDTELRFRRVRATAAALAGSAGPRVIEPRVAASITQLGLCARLLAPALGLIVDRRPLPLPENFVFRDVPGGLFPLGVLTGTDDRAEPTPWPASMQALVGPIGDAVLGDGYRLSATIVRGNVASALAGAAATIIQAEPAAAERVRLLVDAALDSAALRRTGHLEADGQFRRRSCCLIYRLAEGPGLCGDCVLAGGG